ncbi:anti-sigma factor [Glaciecola sp. SC05]|uniref:anti-sigma factor family protein n=1 Tax=Glaciecola sp. SC05 TaxID=1987355 RepID=UPI00352795B7
MKKSDIAMFSAFLDNELSEIERKQFEKRLSTDEKFAIEFANFSQNDQAVRQAFSIIDDKPVPNSILEMLGEPEQNAVEHNTNVVELKSWRRSIWLPVAASFLVIALALPMLLMMNQQSALTLADVLDSRASGQTIEIDESTNVELVMSFSDTQGHFCREYVFSQSTNSEQRISCKVGDAWQTQISSALSLNSQNNYQPASGDETQRVEMWLDKNMSGIPMSIQTERKNLLKNER